MKRILILIICSVFIAGCGGKKNNPAPPADPAKATLVFPDNNAACINGTIVSDTEDIISFSWMPSANTNSYEINIKNLLSGVTSAHTTNTAGIQIHLPRNTPFSWYVVSKSSQVNTTAKSDEWRFYNSGPGIVSHPPFPVQFIAPADFSITKPSSTGKIGLSWSGSDVDNDITGYDVYFGTDPNPPLLVSDFTPRIDSVNVAVATTYYWKVVTKDAKGNTSISDIGQFVTQ